MRVNSIVSCIAKCQSNDGSRTHHQVWKHTAKYLTKYIEADNYYVITPPNEVEILKQISPSNYIILNENEVVSPEYKKAGGWLYQQFLKIQAASIFGPRVLLWDGDTIPLKNLNNFFFPNESDIQIFKSREHIPEYFATLLHLLELPKRLVNFSFIAQCLPVYSQDVSLFKSFVEQLHNIDWKDAVLNSINSIKQHNKSRAFSEYETLGNFIIQQNLRKIIDTNCLWQRNGWSCIQNGETIEDLTEKEMYFCSFESWQKDGKGLSLK